MSVLKARNVMVFRTGAIGDTILTFPALIRLRASLSEGAHVTLVGNPLLRGLAVGSGIVHEVVAFDSPWVGSLFGDGDLDSRPLAPLEGVDLAIVWQRDTAGPLADSLRRRGITTISVPSLPIAGERTHVADHLTATLTPYLGADVTASPSIPPRWQSTRDQGITRRVVIHPGSGGAHKNWPAERFAAVADDLASRSIEVVVTAGPADREAANQVKRHSRGQVISFVEPNSLDELASVLVNSDGYLGNDSGVSHLAAWLGVPTVAIFGPTDPAVWAPRGRRVTVLTGDVECAPCADSCVERRCLRSVSVEQTIAALEDAMGRLDTV